MSSSWIESECFERKGVGFAWLGHYLLVMVIKSREKDIYLELKTWLVCSTVVLLCFSSSIASARNEKYCCFPFGGGGERC